MKRTLRSTSVPESREKTEEDGGDVQRLREIEKVIEMQRRRDSLFERGKREEESRKSGNFGRRNSLGSAD